MRDVVPQTGWRTQPDGACYDFAMIDWSDLWNVGFWLRVLIAFLCGAAIGLERQLRGKPAGIRTSVLICMGTMVFVYMGASFDQSATADPTRVLGQVVTGIGFLGAGVIINREGLVRGMTSAAVIWMLAAVGSSVGLGRFAAAVGTTVVVLGILVGMNWLERVSRAFRRGVHRPDPADSKSS